MPSCLGIYIDGNIIKYAKVSKDNNAVKIEASGVKFHDNTEETIEKIVNETFSYKTPISVNLMDEQYTYAELFSLLNKKDLEKAVQSEFEYFCNENGKNKNALQYKRVLIENPENKDKIKVLYSYVEAANLASKTQVLNEFKLDCMVPISLAIKNLVDFTGAKNSIIVNIERNTTVSTIVNGEVYNIDVLSKGMKEVLEAITMKENSYEKAYEICKNTTIYTKEGRTLQTEENDYLEEIMPTLYSIIREIKEVMAKNLIPIENIYITGLGAVINNIDLYFQENFENQKCEIITPYFTEKTNIKVNIKDYIEVNSATALALQSLGQGTKDISFVDKKGIDFGSLFSGSSEKKASSPKVKESGGSSLLNLGTALDNVERNMIRGAVRLINIISFIWNSYKLTSKPNGYKKRRSTRTN